MTGDKHATPGDADRHLRDGRYDSLEIRGAERFVEGEYEIAAATRIPVSNATTSSTSYTRITATGDEILLPTPTDLDVPGVDSWHISWGTALTNPDTGDGIRAKLGDTNSTYDGTEVASPNGGFTRVHSSRVQYSGAVNGNVSIHGVADGGTCQVREATVYLWALVG